MRKQEFLSALKMNLSGLPEQDIEERLNFYNEMIDDRIEDGRTEEEAVLEFGSVNEIAAQIIAEFPLIKIAKEKIKPKKRLKAWEIVLLALGSPIWLSLAVAAFAVILSLYVALWSLIVSIWAVFIAFAVSSIGSVVASTICFLHGNNLTGVAMAGAGILCAGLSIFLFFGSKAATKGILLFTKKIALGIKKCFIKQEKEQ